MFGQNNNLLIPLTVQSFFSVPTYLAIEWCLLDFEDTATSFSKKSNRYNVIDFCYPNFRLAPLATGRSPPLSSNKIQTST